MTVYVCMYEGKEIHKICQKECKAKDFCIEKNVEYNTAMFDYEAYEVE